MCILFTVLNTTKIIHEDLETLVNIAARNIGESERDGLGLVAKREDGSEFILKTTVYGQDFLQSKHVPFLKGGVIRNDVTFENITSLVLHGRTSTNVMGVQAAHPIEKHDIMLCHNGVVEYSGPEYNSLTGNDTEHLVESLHLEGIAGVTKYTSGYYAAAYYRKNDPHLYLFKDNIAPLCAAYIPLYETYIFCSRHDVLRDILEAFGLYEGEDFSIHDVEDNFSAKFLGNDLISFESITPKAAVRYDRSLMAKSLGKTLDAAAVTVAEGATTRFRQAIQESWDIVELSLRGDIISLDEALALDEHSIEHLVATVNGNRFTVFDFEELKGAL